MNLFVTFGHWSKIFRSLRKFFRQVCQYRFLCVARKILRPNYFLKKASINFFSDLDRFVFGFCRKFFWWGCQNCLLRVHSNILKKKCINFSDVGQNTIGILWQSVRQGCKNCFPGVHGNKLSRKTFRWKPYIFLFRHWAESFQFCSKVFDWVVKTAFHLAKGLFWEVSSSSFCPIFFGHWAKNLQDFVECLSTGLSKLLSSCP